MTKALETLGLLIFIVTSKLWQRLWKSWALEMQDVFFQRGLLHNEQCGCGIINQEEVVKHILTRVLLILRNPDCTTC
jgi:hypothetical protein